VTPHRSGAALVLAVFVLMALGTTSLGLLYVSTQEVLIARAGEESTRARWAAESAVRATLANWSTRRVLTLGPGDEVVSTVAEQGVRVTIARLDGKLFLVTATASAAGARGAAAALVRVVRPEEVWSSFDAALSTRESPEIEPGVVVTAADVGLAPPPWAAESCPDEAVRAMVDALDGRAPAAVSAPGGLPADTADEWRPVATPAPWDPADGAHARVGPFALRDMAALADLVVSGDVRPAPSAPAGACDTAAAANWGAPLDPTGPCGDYFPVIFAPDGLHVTGGAGQGILIVDGDLILSGDAQFFGSVVVTGALVIRDRAAVFGAVKMLGEMPARLQDEARVDYRACSLWRAFTGASALDQAFAPAGRLWVPAW